MIETVPLTPEHLIGFQPDDPIALSDFPGDQFGQAVAVLRDGVTLGVVGAWQAGDRTAWLGLLLTPAARALPITMHRLARQTIRGLHLQGYRRVRAEAHDARGARWLRALGFVETEAGFIHDAEKEASHVDGNR